MQPVVIPVVSRSPHRCHLKRTASQPEVETDLLKSIRSALQGTRSTSDVTSILYSPTEGSTEEDELCFDAYNVSLSSGGVVRRRWNFEEEGQPVQWACIAWFEQPSTIINPSTLRPDHYTHESQSEHPVPFLDNTQRPTFGPFTRAQRDARTEKEPATRHRAVFIFLRSIGKVFFLDGLEYTFHSPFIVRRAWPLSPHGILLQRVLDRSELEDEPLPTIFTMMNPFAEASAVGVTSCIKDGIPVSLTEEDPSKVPNFMAAQEHVLWVSSRTADPTDRTMVTLDEETRTLTVWRYTFVHPKDIPALLNRPSTRPHKRQRSSMSGPLSPRHPAYNHTALNDRPEQPLLTSLPGMSPALSTSTPMAALVPGAVPDSGTPWAPPAVAKLGRHTSHGRLDMSINMDKVPLGGRVEGNPQIIDPVDDANVRSTYWAEKLYSEVISEADVRQKDHITMGVYDQRWDGKEFRARFVFCLPVSKTLVVVPLAKRKDKTIGVDPCVRIDAIAIAPIRATRNGVLDLLIVKSDHTMTLFSYGLYKTPLELTGCKASDLSSGISFLKDPIESSVTIYPRSGAPVRVTLNLTPRDLLTKRCFFIFALVLPSDFFHIIHHGFLVKWSAMGLPYTGNAPFNALCSAIFHILRVEETDASESSGMDAWEGLGYSDSATRFTGDPSLRNLELPSRPPPSDPGMAPDKLHDYHCSLLYALHQLAQSYLLATHQHEDLIRLVPVICTLAMSIRPEWADYWKRLFPDAVGPWPSPAKSVVANLDDRLPVWPPDPWAMLYGMLNRPEWDIAVPELNHLAFPPDVRPSFAFGKTDPLLRLQLVATVYKTLSDPAMDTRKRADHALRLLIKALDLGLEHVIDQLPLGLAAPLREAARTCQLSPAGDWPAKAYQLIGRSDLAEGISNPANVLHCHGYRSMKDFILSAVARKTNNEHGEEVRRAVSGEMAVVSGIELDLEDFTSIRFGQDRRLEEVARMLCSSTVPVIKMIERPELNEHDQAKEQQTQVVRMAERTLALPSGRALFTFGSIPVVTREAYAVPNIEFAVRLQPQNVVVAPEAGKIPIECTNWGEFHNGVAAGLRISPTATGVESSWIKFNKPSELTPEHAGFLYALGLTGHLREMLTWHTFSYLTPKHELTSIAVLLGLSAANVGNSNSHVTRLLAVHTPALLPTPTVDLNVPLIMQAAGLMGIGLLYMGTKNRRMAEVCLSQMSRKDLVQPDLSNEHREAYTFCAALSFGMVMLGKGTDIPADTALLARLHVLVHGEAHALPATKNFRPSFDANLTSPAATIALGLMYLRTERQEVADVLTIPDTILALDRIQPSFLLLRTLARALILWNAITPSSEWVQAQVPESIKRSMEAKSQGKQISDSLELAWYNIIAGCCFSIALKYAGTAREEAYILLIRYYDIFSQFAYTHGHAFDQRIKRAAILDGLNLISLSLCMVMAGTGEIHCLRRLRYAFGLYNQPIRYGTHLSTHMSLGLLFLGGGRYTLGTSDAAVASMVAAFFPRFPQVSSDNKSYLQALRHLWVLAVEPRCLIARDVDTKEVVYLPVKIKVKDGKEVGTTQLIAPTLIPDINKLSSIRVDTPRYWPFYLDIANVQHHKESLLRSQTLFVKRRTAFLSYLEDPKGSRSLFVRPGSSPSDAATLDFPQLRQTGTRSATDLHHFISSFSNDAFFLAVADRYCRDEGETEDEKLFFAYCHATLLDSILQDKPTTMQSHLTLYRYRRMSLHSPYFGLVQQDLRFAEEFYSKIYDRRMSGRSENNPRPSLMRESTLSAAVHELDRKLDLLRSRPSFIPMLRDYARGSGIPAFPRDSPLYRVSHALAWYLQRNSVPVSTLLVVLKALATSSHSRSLRAPHPQGTTDSTVLDVGIKQVLRATGSHMITAVGSGWSLRSVEEIISTWNMAVEESMETTE